MPFAEGTTLDVRAFDDQSWLLLADLVYQGETQRFTVPAGYITDFASVPNFMVWVANKTGRYTRAAVVHDYLLTHGIPTGMVSSRDADGIFRRIMRELNVGFAKRWVMWTAVRWGALFNRHRAPGRQFWKDAPAVLAISLLVLPFLGPAAILVALTKLIISPIDSIP
jgi:hypothetical protein